MKKIEYKVDQAGLEEILEEFAPFFQDDFNLDDFFDYDQGGINV